MAVRLIRETDSLDDIVVVINQLATLVNELKTDYNATLAKLDADAANTALNDTNYAATNGVTSPAADTLTVTF